MRVEPRRSLTIALAVVAVVMQPWLAPPLLADGPSPFAGIPDIDFAYYDISGTDAASINASIAAHGPQLSDGVQSAGRTDYRIDTGWVEEKHGSSCQVTKTTARARLTVVLPRLTTEDRLPPQERAGWRTLIATLARHEAGHARIAYEHEGEVQAALAASHCGEEGDQLRAAVGHIDDLQADYDRRTKHGLAQGNILE